jgi:hypothetical protein
MHKLPLFVFFELLIDLSQVNLIQFIILKQSIYVLFLHLSAHFFYDFDLFQVLVTFLAILKSTDAAYGLFFLLSCFMLFILRFIFSYDLVISWTRRRIISLHPLKFSNSILKTILFKILIESSLLLQRC